MEATERGPTSILLTPSRSGSCSGSATIKDTYRQFGIDLERFQGNGGWLLPIPATLVVGQDGRVKARVVDPDFRHRMAIEDILRAIAGEDAAQAAEGGHAKLALSAAISV